MSKEFAPDVELIPGEEYENGDRGEPQVYFERFGVKVWVRRAFSLEEGKELPLRVELGTFLVGRNADPLYFDWKQPGYVPSAEEVNLVEDKVASVVERLARGFMEDLRREVAEEVKRSGSNV